MLFIEYITRYGSPMILGPYNDGFARKEFKKVIRDCQAMPRGDVLRVELKSDFKVIETHHIIPIEEQIAEVPTATRPRHEVKTT